VETLFPEYNALPPGFSYFSDFLSSEEEAVLMKSIKEIQLHTFRFQGFEAKRRVASFGYDYNFNNGRLSKGEPFPVSFQPLLRKVADQVHIDEKDFAELLVTEYPPGSVINWHRDAPPFKIICGISLLEDCLFKLRPNEKEKQGRKTILLLPVQRRSMYVMQGESRTAWQHSIAPVKQTRYSITLRTLKDHFIAEGH
jgi:alkylated DNA repair dioxygenase AlkB